MLKKLLLLALFSFFNHCVFSQEKPLGKFLKDKVKVGEPVQYTLSYKHPLTEDIIFPDSGYAYTPFEYIDKQYFKTRSDSIFSYDSAVYTISTFELDSVQFLALPVFLIENEDTIKLFAQPDSIVLVPSLTVLPDSIQFMEISSYVKVDRQFNYSYLFIGLAVLLLVIILIILLFGKTLILRLKINRLRKKHLKFLTAFKDRNGKIDQQNFEKELMELYALWKGYLEQLTQKPFTTYSTKEISQVIPNKTLKDNLMKIDKGIYAHRFPENMAEISNSILEVAQRYFNDKLKEITNGSKK